MPVNHYHKSVLSEVNAMFKRKKLFYINLEEVSRHSISVVQGLFLTAMIIVGTAVKLLIKWGNKDWRRKNLLSLLVASSVLFMLHTAPLSAIGKTCDKRRSRKCPEFRSRLKLAGAAAGKRNRPCQKKLRPPTTAENTAVAKPNLAIIPSSPRQISNSLPQEMNDFPRKCWKSTGWVINARQQFQVYSDCGAAAVRSRWVFHVKTTGKDDSRIQPHSLDV